MAILSISSRISRGYIGNTAAGFALRTLGHDVWEVPTVVWNHHPGHGKPAGVELTGEQITDMLAPFAGQPWRDEIALVMTGYFRSSAQVNAAADFIIALRDSGHRFSHVCDPVMGDAAGLYVSSDVCDAIRARLLPLADVVTPNRFELQALTDQTADSNIVLAELANGLDASTVLVTSAFGERGGIGTLLVEPGDTLLHETPELANVPKGTGDLLTALFAGKLLETDGQAALGHAINATWQVIERTVAEGHDELLLADNRRALTTPDAASTARPILDHPSRPLVAGVDGCPAGWLAVFWDGSAGSTPWAEIFADFSSLLKTSAQIIAVDMPIGLAETSGRDCEKLVRQRIGERRSSVFTIPARKAVMEVDYAAASVINLRHSDPPRKISKQSFMLFPKIREVDALITPALQDRVHEVHPELAFWAMNGETALDLPKKVKSQPYGPGLDLRRGLLEDAGFPLDRLRHGRWGKADAGADDLLDACAACWSACRIRNGSHVTFPGKPVRDARGLRMEINA